MTSHKIIYKGMVELYSKSENITPITLFENLNSFSGEIGGISCRGHGHYSSKLFNDSRKKIKG
nr:DnaB-like helicase N-terminal domain-containing protein [Clostridium algidicarnis]